MHHLKGMGWGPELPVTVPVSRAVWAQGDESHFYRGCGELV